MTRINYNKDIYNLDRFLPNVEMDNDKLDSIKDLYISKLEMEHFFDNLNLVKFTEVYTGIGENYNEKIENTLGYGGFNYSIFVEHNNENVIKIWLYNIKYFESKVLKTIFTKLGERWNLSLMDSNNVLIDLNNEIAVQKYLEDN